MLQFVWNLKRDRNVKLYVDSRDMDQVKCANLSRKSEIFLKICKSKKLNYSK